MTSEIRIVNFIDLVYYILIKESVVRSKLVLDFFILSVFFDVTIKIVLN